MKISVNKYTLEPSSIQGGTAGSHGVERLDFDFSEEWKELCKTLIFFPVRSPALVVSFTGEGIELPPEVSARAGRVPFTLCGAKDGRAIISLTGAVEIAESLYPTEDEVEHTPGALEQAALLCAEARADAQAAGASAMAAASSAQEADTHRQSCLDAQEQTRELTQQAVLNAQRAYENGNIAYDNMQAAYSAAMRAESSAQLSGKNAERADPTHTAPIVVKKVSSLPADPTAGTVYYCNGKYHGCITGRASSPIFIYQVSYTSGGGPGTIYSYSPTISVGDSMLYMNTAGEVCMENMSLYADVTSAADGVYSTQYGTFTVQSTEEGRIYSSQITIQLVELNSKSDLTPFIADNPAGWLIGGLYAS